MSTENRGNFPSIGSRFKEERERLGLSQKSLCDFFSIKDPKTIRNWEAGISSPAAEELSLFAEKGADVLYILTGQRTFFVREEGDRYATPARQLAAMIADMALSDEDAELILSVARRLDRS